MNGWLMFSEKKNFFLECYMLQILLGIYELWYKIINSQKVKSNTDPPMITLKLKVYYGRNVPSEWFSKVNFKIFKLANAIYLFFRLHNN